MLGQHSSWILTASSPAGQAPPSRADQVVSSSPPGGASLTATDPFATAVQSMPTLTKLLAQNAAVTKARNDVFLALSEALENASRRFTTGAHHEAASELHARFEAYLRDCLRGGPAHPPKPARRAPRPTTSPPPSSTRSPTGASYAAAVTRPAPPLSVFREKGRIQPQRRARDNHPGRNPRKRTYESFFDSTRSRPPGATTLSPF
jgi:hypothetical protein